MGVLSFLFAASYIGRLLGLASTWTVVFVIGASASATYLVLAPLALSERFRTSILFTNMKRRVIILALVFGPVVAGISYWIYQAGSVEALPVFPYFIAIFYAWILSQAYFIANPVTHAMLKFEESVVGKGVVKRMLRSLGMMVISILGAMQTFARKTVNRADRRWSQVLPFLVFSFGSVYAVSQFYFILQGSLTRAGLSIIVNGIVFAVGTLTLMLLLRSHLKIPRSAMLGATSVSPTEDANLSPPSTEESNVSQTAETGQESQPVEGSAESQDDQSGSGVENMERSDQDTGAGSESAN